MATTPSCDLVAWSADSTALLLTALRAAGPEQGCWAWWGASEAPLTAGAVARHQVKEAAVHAYDAQQTVGLREPVPAAVAVDGVAEFLTVSYGTSGPWPHRPARVGWYAAEGSSWLLDLTPSGAVIARDAEESPAAAVHGSAGELLLALFGRIPLHRLRIEGSRALVEALLAWPSLD
ncbi:maleylpyruvate isomerase N-terminal domain-containing protein [Streptomyces inhibens]|uniref:maleylpyruvate isomerase N-terminal domain-containing protein n=1 Tax=Streptomyces inhibens TaxID=2293571 RepID=UPI001EE72ABC|nr:maleylpyruvate isomerase N-terminal domain-containing protein [Streptomyces inhibens]UKY48292.1 maleylpyruvate isomerase N-terminal domain-containing protein [Streptomyces inhibens]